MPLPPDDGELVIEIDRLTRPAIRAVQKRYGRLAGVGSEAWWSSPDDAKLAALLVLALAWVVYSPERALDDRLKQTACDVSDELRRQRTVIARRRDELGAALRRGDTPQVEALLNRLSGWQWASEDPVVVE